MHRAFLQALITVALSSGAAYCLDSVRRLPVVTRQDIRFTALSIDGQPLKRWVTSIARDDWGFLWFGSFNGLYRYDGYNLKNYRHDSANTNSLIDDRVRAILKDRDGNLWIGTALGLDKFDPARETFTHYRTKPGVGSIYQERSGALWIGTSGGLDRLDPATSVFRHYRHDPDNTSTLSADEITYIFEDSQGYLWVATIWGVNRLERDTGRVTRFLHDPNDPYSLSGNYVGPISQDDTGQLWVAAGNLLEALDTATGKFTHYSFHSEEPGSGAVAGVTSILKGPDASLWLGTVDDGLLQFDRERRKFIRYLSDPDEPGGLRDNSVDALFEDTEGIVWLGSKSCVSRFLPKPGGFVTYRRHPGKPEGLQDNIIWSVQEDSRGFLWIGTRAGLQRLDRRTGQFTLYRHDPKNPHSLSYNIVTSVREDGSGKLWIGTYGGGLNRFDPATGRFFAYRHKPGQSDGLSSDRIIHLLFDHEGALWVATGDGGLNRFDTRSGRSRVYRNDPKDPGSLSLDNVTALFEDRQGILWAGTHNGLNRFDRKSERFTVYPVSQAPGGLSDSVGAIYEDRRGTLWIGTGKGLHRMDRNRGTFVNFTDKDGLPDNTIAAILEDGRGDLWLATHDGLSHFDPLAAKFHNYSESDGLSGNNLNPFGGEGSCLTRSGEMVFGSTDGITICNPSQIGPNPYAPPVVLTDFLLSGKPVRPDGNSLGPQIWALDSLTLTHKQNIFSLEFSALSYVAPDKNHYRYRLEPLETEWNEENSKRRLATYTNLPAGKYAFRVQGSNNDGIWNEQGLNLAITVLPPWWATWWFRSILLVSIAGVIFASYRSRVRSLEVAAARLENQVAQRTQELKLAKLAAETANQAKTAFLANMSHELRTPLNAILGFSSLLMRHGASEEQRKDLEVINRSGEHLLALIDDVLDMAKIEAGRKSVTLAPCDLRHLVQDVMEMIRVRAEEKHLSLVLAQDPAFPQSVRTDAAMVRQVLINLVSNAVRYTEQGSITVRAQAQPVDNGRVQVSFEVEDTGIGIAPEDQKRIFDVFVRVGVAARQKGAGLGLAITRQIVDSLGGTIEVRSALGQGSRFRVEIPVELAPESEPSAAASGAEAVLGLAPGQPECRVLIVEDEPANWMVLERLLKDTGFQVRVAETGAQGVETFQTWRPHFIWMDLLMPVMDGIEATRRIRALDGGREVKIAAVTASGFESERREVLAAGLDDYLRKPYQPAEVFECMARHLGLVYRRAEPSGPSEPVVDLRPELFTALPDALRMDLREALVALNAKRIANVVEKVATIDPALATVLARYADQYSYTPILDAINSFLHKTESAATDHPLP